MDGVIAFWKVFAECKQKERGYEIRKKAAGVQKWLWWKRGEENCEKSARAEGDKIL